MKRKIIAFISDFLIAALLLGGIYGVNYLIPQKGIMAQTMTAQAADGKLRTSTGSRTSESGNDLSDTATKTPEDTSRKADNLAGGMDRSADNQAREKELQTLADNYSNGLPTTRVSLDSQDWHQKFADKFTDQVISTDTSYTSPNVSVQITRNSYNTNRLDKSQGGKHVKYGTNISYVLADIYVSDITCLQTWFAQNTYGVGYDEKLSDMSARMKSVLAVNGDSYSNSRHKSNGTIIRNGVIYRAQPTDMETCVLNWDGTMKIYNPEEMNTQQLIDSGAYQSWIFGPSLLDENGKAKTTFRTWPYITESHPRTAIGYYEPGHYCMLVVDGRQDSSRGMFLDEMANLFEQLGCKAAYNLDGGHCSFMTLQDQVANNPYKPEHKIEDGIFITEIEYVSS